MEGNPHVIVDQSKISDAVIHTAFRGITLVWIGLVIMLIVAMVYSAANVIKTDILDSELKLGMGLVLLFTMTFILFLTHTNAVLLVNPYPKLWLFQEGILLRYLNKPIILGWGDLFAVRERSHSWKFWRRDRLIVFSNRLPKTFGKFEKFQTGGRKIYVMGDATNFARLDDELQSRGLVRDLQ